MSIRDKRYVIGLPAFLLSLIVGMAFLLHFFINTFSGLIYIIIVFALAMSFVISKPIRRANGRYLALWFLSFSCIAVSYVLSQRSNDGLMDVAIILCGLLLLVGFTIDEKVYKQSLSLISAISMFFAAGILLQRFLPASYNITMTLFPSDLSNVIKKGVDDTMGGYRGFTTNTGFSAGYICAGLLAYISMLSGNRLKRNNYIKITILLVALIFTGKRGPILFLVLTIMLCYLIPVRGNEKMKRYWKIFLSVFVVSVVFVAFYDVLANIPIVREITKTLGGLVAGDDVTSSRSALYGWAFRLFREKPLFGIGWGMFRSTTVGNVTKIRALEVHNVYLQLLCETGIVGFICIFLTLVAFWTSTKSAYCQCVISQDERKKCWKPVLFFSFAYQTFFLLYGLSGNVLYDQHYQILYFLSCSIYMAYQHVTNYTHRKRHIVIPY